MEASELRTFSVEELQSRIHQWRDELFRARFRQQTAESKDTSIFKKLRKDIARGQTVLVEKLKGQSPVVEVMPPEDKVATGRKKASKREEVGSDGK